MNNNTITIDNINTLINSNIVFYTPTKDYYGEDSFTYTISDGELVSDITTIYLNILSINDTPRTFDQTITINEDSTKIIELAMEDPTNELSNSSYRYIIVTQPNHGSIEHINININSNIMKYTPNKDYNGSDSFTFKVNDGMEDSNISTINIHIQPINDKPIGISQNITVIEDTHKNITLTVEEPPDETIINYLYKIIQKPTKGILDKIHNSGELNNNQGEIVYMPNINVNGSDILTYTVSDGILESNETTIFINIKSVNDKPVAKSQVIELEEDNSKMVILEVDEPSDELDTSNYIYTILTQPINGSLGNIIDNQLIYTPDTHFHGSDIFSFKVSDGELQSDEATVSLIITAINDTPITQSQNIIINQNETKEIILTSSDASNENTNQYQYIISIAPQSGTITKDRNRSNVVIYQPNMDYSGGDSFSYKIKDGLIWSSGVRRSNLLLDKLWLWLCGSKTRYRKSLYWYGIHI